MPSKVTMRGAVPRHLLRGVLLIGALLSTTGCAGAAVPTVWFLTAGSPPDPADSTVQIMVESPSCSSGKEAVVVGQPEVILTADVVVIGVEAREPRGAQSCQGVPLAPVTVDLGEPLGDRVLVDLHGTLDDEYAPAQERYEDIEVPPAASAPPSPSARGTTGGSG